MKMFSRVSFLSAALLAMTIAAAYARAGGGGGEGFGGGGDGDGLLGLVFWIILAIPFPWNLILIGIIVVIGIIGNRKKNQASGLNKVPSVMEAKTSAGYGAFKQKNADFDENGFKKKAFQAFNDIQQAWESQDLSKARKYISDGVYQRFTTQFRMMQLLGQKNTLKNIQVKNLYIADVESDGSYDIVHVGIEALITDEFKSSKYKNLDEGGTDHFVEFWSFIKKRGAQTKDIFSTNNCPSCGGDLPQNAGELSQCAHCGTLTNTGEYDWVLSEITQADDFANQNKKLQKDGTLTGRIRSMLGSESDFSFQLLEDKASNGYMQIMTALVKKQPAAVRRFVGDALFSDIEARINGEIPFIFNRLYLNDVTIMDAYQSEGQDHLVVAVKSSSQKVKVAGDKAEKIDHAMIVTNDVMIMSRDSDAGAPKGALYAHKCPSCGGPLQDTLDTACAYCGAEVNSTKYEWIITEWMPAARYPEFKEKHKQELLTKALPDQLDALYDVRDYAFNNIMILVAADGHFDEEEKKFAHMLAKKWGYHPDKVHAVYEMAENHKLVLRLPEDPKKRRRVYAMMDRAAHIDGKVTEHEQEILDDVKRQLHDAA